MGTATYPSHDLLGGDGCTVLRTGYTCDRLFRVDSFFANLGLDFGLGRINCFFFGLLFFLVGFAHR